MKLLILTQKVDKNDDILGFFHGWIAEFAKSCEKITVIALGVGEFDLLRNVKVLSLGKEKFPGHPMAGKFFRPSDGRRIRYLFNFYKYIWRERKNYDTVFVHMNPEYVVLGGLFWKIWRKKIGLWYMHKAINFKLRIAEKLTDVIFSATPESFRLKSKKLKITGHGIDIDKFQITNLKPASPTGRSQTPNQKFDILCVGRISPIKNQKLLIEAIDILVNQQKQENLKIVFVGGASSDKDRIYREELRKLVKNKKLEKNVVFEGSIPNKEIIQYYNMADLSINMSMTGSLDKVILEAMACQVITLSCNDSSKNLLEKYGLFFKVGDYKELAEKIKRIIELPKEKKESIQKDLQYIVVVNHNLERLIKTIIEIY